jgi:hypothetical protein
VPCRRPIRDSAGLAALARMNRMAASRPGIDAGAPEATCRGKKNVGGRIDAPKLDEQSTSRGGGQHRRRTGVQLPCDRCKSDSRGRKSNQVTARTAQGRLAADAEVPTEASHTELPGCHGFDCGSTWDVMFQGKRVEDPGLSRKHSLETNNCRLQAQFVRSRRLTATVTGQTEGASASDPGLI